VGLGRSATFRFNGQRRGWVLQLAAGQQLLTPAYAGGRVYVGAGFTSTTVFALDAHSGALRWQADTPDGGPSAAIVDERTVLFNTESCTLFAFDAQTGRQRWSKYLGDPLMSQPASGGGRVFTAWPDGNSAGGFSFGALSLRNGRVLWSRPVSADVMTAPVVVGDAVYATLMDGTVARWRANDGRRQWSRAAGATSAPAVDGDRVYVAQRADRGHERPLVLGATTGAVASRGAPVAAGYVAQRPDTDGTEPGWAWEGSRPAVADGRVYQAMGDEIVARSRATGEVVWRKRNPMGGRTRGVTSPAVVGSQLVVGTRGGDLFGLDIDSGQTTWAVRVGEPIGAQPAVADGWVYVATARGKVIGLEIGDRALDGWHMWGGNAGHTGLTAAAATGPAAEATPTAGTLRAVSASGDLLPMVHTDVDAAIDGPVARVTVTQEFSNPHAEPIDAEYLFPLPGDAAVDAMELRVGGRLIAGGIRTRGEARRTYDAARLRGRTAALLEQERPSLFRQAVANIRPGERVSVRLRFVETVPWRDGGYELALPLRAGAPGAAAAQAAGDAAVRATVNLGIALASIGSPSHAVTVTGAGAGARAVALAAGRVAADRDYVLRYAPRATVAAPAVLTSEGPDGRYLTLQLHPAPAVDAALVTPRELVFAVDASSSMRGAPLAQAQAVVRAALRTLRAGDTFRVLAFADSVTASAPAAVAADPAGVAAGEAFVGAIEAAGSTGLRAGLDAALAGPVAGNRLRVVVLLSDGYAGDERAVLAAARRSLGAARVFTLGVGSAVNRYLLETLAEEGRGESAVVVAADDPAAAAGRFAALLDRPCLTDVSVDFGDLDVREAFPRVMPDLYAGRPVLLHARYGRGGRGTITVRGLVAGRRWEQRLAVDLPTSTGDAGARTAWDRDALPSLWARARVKDLSRAMLLGEVAAMRDEVTALGLRFGLVTEYTSFVAVDEAPAQGAAVAVARPTTVSASLGLAGLTGTGMGGGSAVYALAARASPAPAARVDDAMPHRQAATVAQNAPSLEPRESDAPDERARAMTALRARVRALLNRALRATPDLRGPARIEVTVGDDGRVTAARVVGDPPGWAEFSAGLLGALAGLEFPPNGATTVVITVAAGGGV
jgi:Ca-activated chloride channel family protein